MLTFLLMLLPFISNPDTCYYFKSDSCRACQEMTPIVEELQDEGYDIKIFDIQDRATKLLKKRYDIEVVPAFVFREDRKIVDTHIGTLTEHELRRKLDGQKKKEKEMDRWRHHETRSLNT